MADSSSSVNNFLEFARSKGYEISGVSIDGKLHRFLHGKRKNGWYIGFSNYSKRLNREFIYAKIGDWASGETHEFRENSDVDRKTIQEVKDRIEEEKLNRQKELEDKRSEAAKNAQEIWDTASAADSHPYLTKKKIPGLAARISNGILLIPMFHVDQLCGIQEIHPDGFKKFMAGQRFKGSYMKIGAATDRIYLCEGYATGVTIHQATGCQVIVAFSAGNLLPVAQQFQGYKITICADNDQWTEGNPGLDAAEKAAKITCGQVIKPSFSEAHQVLKPTDFNDLYILEGIDVVKNQLTESGNSLLHTSEQNSVGMRVRNFEFVEIMTQRGAKTITTGLQATDIWQTLPPSVGEHIKRVGRRVFANGNDQIQFFDSPSSFFGWIATRGVHSEWGRARDMISKDEFLSFIGGIAENYDYATELPHYPSAKGFYYIHKIEPRETGRLDDFCSFFLPDTDKDIGLTKAAAATPFWGRGFGRRPGFLITARDDDENQGKGTGKSTLAESIGRLAGPQVDLSKKADDESMRKALLSANFRTARFDNVKGGSFSSEALESIMTSPILTAHRLYHGIVAVPNVYTFF